MEREKDIPKGDHILAEKADMCGRLINPLHSQKRIDGVQAVDLAINEPSKQVLKRCFCNEISFLIK